MKVVWVRGNEQIKFTRPNTFMVLGVRGSAKSSLLEHVGEYYLDKGNGILDLFGSRDGEDLAWCRSRWAKDKRILLIRGDNTDVDCSFDTKKVSDVRQTDFNKYDILISSSPLYSSPDMEFLNVNKLTNLIYKRLSWNRIIYTIVREASNLYYSRLKLTRNQLLAKSEMIYLIREARHMGIAMALDTLKFTSIDLDVRVTIDYLFFKSLGLAGLPSDLEWLYGFYAPTVIRNMPLENFVLLTKNSHTGFGCFPEVPWHKQEREHILKRLDIKVEHGEEIKGAKDMGTFLTVSDKEHIEIIDGYASGRSMRVLSSMIGRSS